MALQSQFLKINLQIELINYCTFAVKLNLLYA